MNRDVILNKRQTIDRCLTRILEEYDGNPAHLTNYTRQDSIVLNIQRACEASIDLAMHVVSERKLGLPQSSRDAFELLHQNGLLDESLTRRMKAMVGFRNIAVHDYRSVQADILQSIIEHHLDDFRVFSDAVLRMADKN